VDEIEWIAKLADRFQERKVIKELVGMFELYEWRDTEKE